MTLSFRPVLYIIGHLLVVLSIFMLFPALVDAYAKHSDWQVFLASQGLTLFVGALLILANRQEKFTFSIKQAFLLTGLSWIIVSAFGALPFCFGEYKLKFTDAFFEAMSAMTTTGATIMTGLDTAPPGLLLWRAIMQGLGGAGIIAVAVAFLPMLQVGGMQIFRTESSDRSEKLFSSATQISAAILLIYIFFIILCFIGYLLCGLSIFESACHALTTVGTGGFSTHDASIGFFNNPYVELNCMIFMFLGSCPFLIFVKMIVDDYKCFWRDPQIQVFAKIIFAFILLMIFWRQFTTDLPFLHILREVSFNTIAIISSAGFATASFDTWGTLPIVLFLLLMFIGGCSGSSAGGIKIFRFKILFATIRVQIQRLIYPKGVLIAYYDNKPVEESVLLSITSFFYLFIITFCTILLLLSLTGVDFLTAFSGTIACLSNIGPGLGPLIGPNGNFIPFNDFATWVLSFAMLLGRLELFTIYVLFAKRFWTS